MTDGLRDIIIKIVPELEDKDYKKHLQEMADNSKSAMEKAFRNLDKSVSLAFKDLEKGVTKGDSGWQSQIQNYLDTFKSMQDYMSKTGFLPNDVNTKLYQAYANIVKIHDKIISVGNAAQRNLAESKQQTEEYTKWKAGLDVLTKTWTNMNEKVAQYEDKLAKAEQVQPLKEQLTGKNVDQKIQNYAKYVEKIEEYNQRIAKLQAEASQARDFRNQPGRNEESRAAILKSIEQLESQIHMIENQRANTQRAMNSLGKANIPILQQIYEITKGDIRSVEQLEEELEKALEAASRAEAEKVKYENAENKPEQFTYDYDSYNKAQEYVKRLINELIVAAQKTDELEQHAKKTGASFNQWRNVVWSFSRLLGNVYTIGLDIVRGAKQIANFYVKIWNTAKKVLSTLKQWRKHITGTANEHAKSWKQMLKDIIRYSLGIRSIFALFRRLRGYIKEAFTAMAEQIPEVNAMLASLKSSLYALKGSLATAFEPILSAIAPALVRLIDLLAKAITYIGMFFAALTGRSYVYKANKVAQTIGKAAGAAKELNKQLQGFDELNNLTSSSGGGGGGGDTPLAQFEKVDVPEWIKNLADILKKAWEDFLRPIKSAWAKVGDEVVAAWTKAFNNVKTLLSNIVKDFFTAWNNGFGESITTNILKIVRDIGNGIANLAEKINDAWTAVEEGANKSNGLRFWEAILGIIDKVTAGIQKITEDTANWIATINLTPAMTAFVHWLESLVSVAEMAMEILYQFWDRALKPILTWAFDGENSGIARFFQILADFNNKLDMPKIIDDLNKIWDALGRFGINIGEGLLIFMEKMLGYLAEWLNSDDFTQWCQDVADFLDGLNPEDLADDLEQVWTIIKNIANELWTAIKYVIDHKDQILDFLEWCSKHLKEIAAIFLGGKLAIDFARFIANLLLAGGAISKFVGGLGSASGLIASIGSALPIILAVVAAVGLLVAAYGGVGEVVERVKKTVLDVYDKVKKKSEDLGLPKKIQDLKDSLKKLGESFDKILVPIQKVLVKFGLLGETSTGLKGAFEIMFAYITVVFTALFTCVATQITSIIAVITDAINFVSGIVQIVSGVFELIVGIVTFDGQKIKEGATDIWEGVKTTFSSGIKFVKDLFKGFIDTILAPFKAIKYALVGDPIVIDMWEEIKRVFDESIGKVIDFVKNLKEKVIELFTKLKEKIEEKVKDIKAKFKEFADDIKQKKDDIANKLTELKEKFVEKFNDIKSKLQEKVQDVKSKLTELASKFTEIKNNIAETLSNIVSKIREKLDDAKSKIDTFKSNISTALNNVKDTFVKAFENIKEGIKTPINEALGFVEKFVNGVIRAINRLGDKLGDFEFDIPDALADKFDLPTNFKIDVPRLSEISIPRLAQGAVIPPNKEFLAVLGDQKRGTNIEAPLDTMVEAFNMANRGGNEQELRLLQEQNDLLRQLLNKEFGISERQIYNSVINQDNIRRKSTGSSAFAY